MNDRDMARKISLHLNHGANQLERPVLERLQSARKAALAIHAQSAQVGGMVTEHGVTDLLDERGHVGRYFWAMILLVLSLMIVDNWQEFHGDPIDDVDATLLSADLPVNAFLDSDFDEWLLDQPAEE
jgi:hypothetical protein